MGLSKLGNLFLITAFVLASTVAKGQGPAPAALYPSDVFEQLFRMSAQLTTELARARQIHGRLPQVFYDRFAPNLVYNPNRPAWGPYFYQTVLAPIPLPAPIPGAADDRMMIDYRVAETVFKLRERAAEIADVSLNSYAQVPQFFPALDIAYHNAVAATYFYIEVVRQSFLIHGFVPNPIAGIKRDMLIRQLDRLIKLTFIIREMMLYVRINLGFGVPAGGLVACSEWIYRPYRNIPMAGPVGQPYLGFPFFDPAAGKYFGAPVPTPQGTPMTSYNPYVWQQNYNQFDSFINAGMPAQGAPAAGGAAIPPQGGMPADGGMPPADGGAVPPSQEIPPNAGVPQVPAANGGVGVPQGAGQYGPAYGGGAPVQGYGRGQVLPGNGRAIPGGMNGGRGNLVAPRGGNVPPQQRTGAPVQPTVPAGGGGQGTPLPDSDGVVPYEAPQQQQPRR